MTRQNQKQKNKLPRDQKGRFLGGVAQQTNKNGTAGRPTVFTEDVQDKLVYALSTGSTVKDSTKYAGVSVRAFFNFVARDKAFNSRVQKYIKNLKENGKS